MMYEAKLVKVLEGDSVRLEVNLGFNLTGVFDFQLVEYETEHPQKPADIKKRLSELLRKAHKITVEPTGLLTGAGRWWALVHVTDHEGKGVCVNEILATPLT